MDIRVRELRKAAGMTQEQLANAINMSARAIQTWERGQAFPNAEAIWNMSVLFKTDPNALLGWWDEHPRPSKDRAPLTHDEELLLDDYRTCFESDRRSISKTTSLYARAARESSEEVQDAGRLEA